MITYYRVAYDLRSFRQEVKELARHVAHLLRLKITKLILANSSYTANLLKEVGINAKVLYLPVRSKEVISHVEKWVER